MPLHFVADQVGDADVGGTVTLTGAEAHHAATVRRVRVGEPVTLTDGRGVWSHGRCEAVGPGEVVVRVESRTHHPAPVRRFVLVQALAKGGRDEMAVQAATELGADEIVPWQAARSVSRWSGPKLAKGTERWRTIVREAAKQAHRAWIPAVGEPVTAGELVGRAEASVLLVLDPTATTALGDVAASLVRSHEDVLVVVGPEGGISDEELAQFDAARAHRVALGSLVLRTSTAGPAALAVLSTVLGRW